MDTMNDTKMQPAKDAVIEELRKMQPTAWVYEDMLGRKCVGFERPLHRRNTHEPLFSAATHAVVMGLVNRLEAAEKGRDWHAGRCEDAMNKCDALRAKITEMEISKHEISEAHNAVTRRLSVLADENITLRAKIERMERQEPVAWTTKLALRHGANALGFDACAGNLWGEKGVPLYALPGAKGEEK